MKTTTNSPFCQCSPSLGAFTQGALEIHTAAFHGGEIWPPGWPWLGLFAPFMGPTNHSQVCAGQME